MPTSNLVVSSWMKHTPVGEPPFAMTRKAEACGDTVLFVRDIWAFTGGEPNAWSPEKIKEVTDWREPFGGNGTREITERCDLVVVPCPEVTYRELRTPEFLAAWKRFADDNGVCIELHYEATIDTLMPRDGREKNFTFGVDDEEDFGLDNDATAYVVFFTKERYELVGATRYWREVLGALELNGGTYYDPLRQSIDLVNGGKPFTDEDWKFFIAVFAENPERLFGIYDTFWNDALLNQVHHVTVIRFEKGVIVEDGVAREPRKSNPLDAITGRKTEPETGRPTDVVTGCVFAIEALDARGRRHRGGR
jgi:hypothetical protein